MQQLALAVKFLVMSVLACGFQNLGNKCVNDLWGYTEKKRPTVARSSLPAEVKSALVDYFG